MRALLNQHLLPIDMSQVEQKNQNHNSSTLLSAAPLLTKNNNIDHDSFQDNESIDPFDAFE